MSSGEYQAIMKELGSTAQQGRTSRTSDGSSSANKDDVLMAHLTLRLDAQWEKFAANLAVQWLELGRTVVQSLQMVAHAASACLLLYGCSCIVRALADVAMSASSSNTRSDKKKEQ